MSQEICTCELKDNSPETEIDIEEFTADLEDLINVRNVDAYCNVPDYILAAYLVNCLSAFNAAHAYANHQLGLVQ
jgi:hypothetical protein